MGVRVSASQDATSENGENEVTITPDDKGGGGGSFTADITASYDKTKLTPDVTNSGAVNVCTPGTNNCQVKWTGVSVRDSGTDFKFKSTCGSGAGMEYAIEVKNTGTNATACVTLDMDCSGSKVGPSETCD